MDRGFTDIDVHAEPTCIDEDTNIFVIEFTAIGSIATIQVRLTGEEANELREKLNHELKQGGW